MCNSAFQAMFPSIAAGIVSPLRSALVLLCLAVVPATYSKTPVHLAAVPELTPDGSTLIFTWNDDLWKVPSTGGQAQALTRHPGRDQWGRISPDGREIAFTSNRLGSDHMYVIPIEGGEPERIGFHSEGYTPECWTPDGASVICSAWRDYPGILGERHIQVNRKERSAEALLFDAFGDNGRVSPDGTQFLFCRDAVTLYRQGYEGSRASTIWLADLKTGALKELCNHPQGSRSPLWRPDGKGFYFLSQENAPCFNVWEMNLADGAQRQMTFFDDANVIMPGLSRDGSTLVFRQLFDFWRMDPRAKEKPVKLDIWVEEDGVSPTIRRRWYSTVWNNDSSGTLDWTKDGKQMCFVACGDLWVMDTSLREPVRLTSGTLTREIEAIFSPDGEAIYFLRDSGSAVNIWRATRSDPKQPWWRNRDFKLEALTEDEQSRVNLGISPDGKTLSYALNVYDLMLSDTEVKNPRQILHAAGDIYYDWAPDSQWLSVTMKDTEDNYDCWIVSATGKREPYNFTRHASYDMGATWSPDGGKIAFYSQRGLDSEMDVQWVYLRQEDEDRNAAVSRVNKASGIEDKPTKNIPVRIDFEGLTERIHRVSIPDSGDYSCTWSPDGSALGFHAKVNGKSGFYKITFPNPGAPQFVMAQQGTQAKWLANGVHWMLDNVPARDESKFDLKIYEETNISEYRQYALRKIWRTLRDNFYDETHNGKDWNAILEKYDAMAAKVVDWGEFGRVVAMLEGELNASHTGFTQTYKEWPRWSYKEWKTETAHVGLRFDHQTKGPVDGIRIAGVIAESPCDRAGARVLPGDFLQTVDGKPVRPGMDLTEVFNGRSGRLIELQFAKVTGEQRRLRVQPESYKKMRERVGEAWRDDNARRVSRQSEGRYAYIHVDQMNWDKFHRFEHEIFSLGYGKEGLVLDVRNNRGGFTADRMLSILCRPIHAWTIPRGGELSYPRGYLTYPSWDKPLVVLCNQYTGSNGEIFSHAMKTLKRAKLIGVPTQGAVISMPTEKILDIGTLSIPRRGWFVGNTGEDMELNGAVPDHIVKLDPRDIPEGRDPQLDKAVEVLRASCAEFKSRTGPPIKRAHELRNPANKQANTSDH